MRVTLTGRHVEMTPALRQLVNRRLQKVDRLLNDRAVSSQVTLSLQRHVHLVDLTLHARGDHVLTASGRGATWPLALKDAVEKLSQQAHTLKEKWARRKRRQSRPSAAGAAEGGTDGGGERVTPPARRILRVRHGAVKPMNVEDAALRVESAREPFLVFRNASTDAVNIIYRRGDGRLALIEPDV